MDGALAERLVCPACRGELAWNVRERRGERIEAADMRCHGCERRFRTRFGIGVLALDDGAPTDTWEQAESGLSRVVREQPELGRALLESPPDSLAPADLFFRSLLLAERGAHAEARGAAELAERGLYTDEWRACLERQLVYVVERVRAADRGPIVDVASGRGHLLEALARECAAPVVGSDSSPLVLRRTKGALESVGLAECVSLLVFDARRMPFRDGSVGTVTTLLGLPHVSPLADLLRELRRVARELLAITHFYPADDEPNGPAIRDAGAEIALQRESAQAAFAEAGWDAEVVNVCFATALPTPKGQLLEDAVIDALPVAETRLEWCVVVAR